MGIKQVIEARLETAEALSNKFIKEFSKLIGMKFNVIRKNSTGKDVAVFFSKGHRNPDVISKALTSAYGIKLIKRPIKKDERVSSRYSSDNVTLDGISCSIKLQLEGRLLSGDTWYLYLTLL